VCASVGVVLLAASAAAPSQAGAGEQNGLAAKLVQAYEALQQGRPAQAVAIYDRLVNTRKLAPELLARALLNRGLAHQRLSAFDAAIRDYDAALRIDALSARARVTALYNRALAFRAKGDAGRAIEDLTAALYIDPSFAPAYFARGNILHERGLYYLALADYDQALANDHAEKHRVHYARALLFSALNSLPRTQEALYAALKEKPDFAPARKRLAAILKGRLPKTKLFADLLERSGKRIADRITPASGSGAAESNIRTASVMIVGAPVINVRKAPQAAPVRPPVDAARQVAAKPQDGWRVAAVGALPPAPAAAREAARADAGEQAPAPASQRPAAEQAATGAVLHTASISAVSRQQKDAAAAKAVRSYRGWAIQLASQRSEDAARAHWRKLERKVRRVVRGGEVDVMQVEIPGKGTFYRLRLVGFDDRARARSLCRSLKRSRVSCLVVRAGG